MTDPILMQRDGGGDIATVVLNRPERMNALDNRRLADPRPQSAEEIAESYACFDTEDCRTGYRAFLDKKQPRSTGR